MSVSDNNSLPTNEAREGIAESQLVDIDNLILELQEAAKSAKKRRNSILRQRLVVRGQLLYLSIAQFVRNTIAPIFGWRWAVVLIGATAVGALFIAIFLSWLACLGGVVIGAALFTALVSIPSNPRLASIVTSLNDSLAELTLRQNEERNILAEMEKERSAALENRRQVADQIEQYRQSRLYRLQQLSAQNWKAMRGGDLEVFLEEVFTELQYAVERMGKSGDQGVDLIVGKDGSRIAVQVKGYLDSVPNTAIQEAFTGMAYYKCDACAVITNSRFTSSGKNVACSVGCALIDENTLPMLILGQIDLLYEILTARESNGQLEKDNSGH